MGGVLSALLSIVTTHPPCKQMLAAVVGMLVASSLSCYLVSITVLSSVVLCRPSLLATAHPPCKQMLAVVMVVLVATVIVLCVVHIFDVECVTMILVMQQ